MRRLLALVVLAAAATGCKHDQAVVPPGSYAGSDAEHRPVTIDVGGAGGLSVGSRPARRQKDGTFLVRADARGPQVRVACRTTSGPGEITCSITRGGGTESVLLMRL